VAAARELWRVCLPIAESVHRTIPILALVEEERGKVWRALIAPKRNWYTRQTGFSPVNKTTNGTLV
jgi:hypothetical protein